MTTVLRNRANTENNHTLVVPLRKKRRRNAVCASMLSNDIIDELKLLSAVHIDGEEEKKSSVLSTDKSNYSSTYVPLVSSSAQYLQNMLTQTKSFRFANFDLHSFAAVAGPIQVLPSLAMAIFHDVNNGMLLKELNINESKLRHYLCDIAGKYLNTNHFHNSYHAADVGQTIYAFLYSSPKLSRRLTSLDKFTLLLSAFVHDVGHTGVNNDFLIKTYDPLAIMYNDQSVLENYHINLAWETLSNHTNNFFIENFTKEQKRRFRTLMIKVILATDNAKHFEKVEQVKTIKYSGLDKDGFFTNKDFIMEILLHAADISNPSKSFRIYGKWVNFIMDEFYLLGDKEKKENVQLTEIFKRGNSRAKVQHGFLKYFVEPLFVEIDKNIDGIDFSKQIANIQFNMNHWKKLMKDEV